MVIPVAKKAWMAGIIDLRGRVVYKNNKRRNHSNQVTLYVESVQIPVIRRLAELTGGNPEIKVRNRSKVDGWFRRNCDEHCPEAHVHVNPGDFLDAARWTISGSAMSTVLINLQPYLVQDKGFSEAIAYGMEHMRLWGQGAAATITALRRLHSLGWTIPTVIDETRPGLFIKIKGKNKEITYADAQGWPAQEGVSEVPDLQVVPGE